MSFKLSLIAKTFQIKPQEQCDHLDLWVQTRHELSSLRTQLLEELHESSKYKLDYWNEEELKMRLISQLFYLAKIEVEDRIDIFFERKLSAVIQNHKLSVQFDCMVATPEPFNQPDVPYFFLQVEPAKSEIPSIEKFKKGKGEKNDPEAQMLIAMLIAQHKNADDKPIYGGFLVGRNWYFTTLIGKKYCLSRQFDATIKKDLFQIVYILCALKDLILNR